MPTATLIMYGGMLAFVVGALLVWKRIFTAYPWKYEKPWQEDKVYSAASKWAFGVG